TAQQSEDAAVEARDDGILPRHGRRKIDTRLGHADADGIADGEALGGVELFGRVDQRLRGDAADVEAGPPETPRLDQHGIEAELAGADRTDVAAGTAAEHQHGA